MRGATSEVQDLNDKKFQLEEKYNEKLAEINKLQIKLNFQDIDHQTYRMEMDQLIKVKNERVEKLDKAKLTQDQLEKFKAIRAESLKKSDDNKMMKKQLVSLKKAFDELAAKQSSIDTTSSSYNVLNEHKYSELLLQCEQSQGLTNALKDKLKECSKQLHEYETERSVIMECMELCGFDVSGLIVMPDEDANESAGDSDQDLVDIMSQLTTKFQALTKHANTNNEAISKLEEMNSILSADLSSNKIEKLALEKRIESMKSSTALSKSENTELYNKIVVLQTNISDLKDKIQTNISDLKDKNAQLLKQINSNQETISSEIKILEEEKFGT
jgi:chromosome segregation ATPase